jgi:hypothetical protein
MLCQCACGTTKVVGLGNLRHGQVTSCGCARSDRAIDVPLGTVFGYLTVIGEAPRVGPYKSRAMLCRCECGEQTVVPLSVLRSGNTKSCGCRGSVDLAAREVFGEFAKLNFDYGPGAIADARLQAIRSAGSFRVRRTRSERMVERWRKLQPVTRTCVNCGREYESRSLRPSSCCGRTCRTQWYRRRKREREQEQQREGRLF